MQIAAGALLAQVRPSGTSAEVAFTAPRASEVTRVVICNTTANAVTASLFHDDTGSALLGEANALLFGIELLPNTTQVIESPAIGAGYIISEGGRIGVQSGTASAITFSLYGLIDVRGLA